MDDSLTILQGDAMEQLKTLPDESVHCCVTSPPYWGLRNYIDDDAPEKRFELGLEKTPEEYLAKMVAVFHEVKRVLRKDGTLWLNEGDAYASGGRGGGMDGERGEKQRSNEGALLGPKKAPPGLKPKDLCGMPWRLAFALQADGWYLRSDIIWHKPNPMPESVTDRPTKSHEYIFLLSKSANYFYDAEAVKEPAVYDGQPGNGRIFGSVNKSDGVPQDHRRGREWEGQQGGRNKRSVWTVPSFAYSDYGYDFSKADYVDRHGIPRKWSPDCPVHEQDGQLRQVNRATVSCGEQQHDQIDHSERTAHHHVLAQPSSVYPTDNCKTNSHEGNPSCGHQKNKIESKTSGEIDAVEREKSSRKRDIQPKSDPSKMDCSDHTYEHSAISHNIGTCKNSHDDLGVSVDKDDGEPLSRKHRKEPCLPAQDENISPNKSEELSLSFASPLPVSRTAHIESSKTCNKDKCLCTISQVSHFATFPPDLIKPCILAGTSARGCCAKCGAPWERVVEDSENYAAFKDSERKRKNGGMRSSELETAGLTRGSSNKSVTAERKTTGWRPTCQCQRYLPSNAAMLCAPTYAPYDTVPCTVLDPFGGSGTSGMVALELGRKAILIELKPEYIELARRRCEVTIGFNF